MKGKYEPIWLKPDLKKQLKVESAKAGLTMNDFLEGMLLEKGEIL